MERLRIDFHTHLIPEVDDGSRGAVETVAMARGLARLGVERIHLTPHQFRFRNDFSELDLMRLTDNVWRLLARADVQIEVVRSAEYYYGNRFTRALKQGEQFLTVEHEGEDCVLIELPLSRPAVAVRRVAQVLMRRGVRPVMAHPERIECLLANPQRLHGWREAGWLLQLNLLSLVGYHGEGARALAHRLLRDGDYTFVGSDLHRPFELETLRRAHEVYRSIVTTETLA